MNPIGYKMKSKEEIDNIIGSYHVKMEDLFLGASKITSQKIHVYNAVMSDLELACWDVLAKTDRDSLVRFIGGALKNAKDQDFIKDYSYTYGIDERNIIAVYVRFKDDPRTKEREIYHFIMPIGKIAKLVHKELLDHSNLSNNYRVPFTGLF